MFSGATAQLAPIEMIFARYSMVEMLDAKRLRANSDPSLSPFVYQHTISLKNVVFTPWYSSTMSFRSWTPNGLPAWWDFSLLVKPWSPPQFPSPGRSAMLLLLM
jgi:hypothetical protein